MREWTKNIRKVVPYVPGKQPKSDDIIKINTNENPYPPSPLVTKALNDIKDLRLYPDAKVEPLVKALSAYHNINEDEIFIGVGSDDVLAMAFLTFFNSNKPILFPDITYSFYDVWADLFRIPYKTQPLDGDFNINKEDYFVENGGIIFPNPNAPTGVLVDLDFIREILDNNQESVVIVDEAYIDFGGASALPLIKEYDNLIVVRTFSKSRSLAGVRIGYAMGNKDLIKALNDVKYSFNSYTMNQPSMVLGVASVKDEEYFVKTVKEIVDTREWFKVEMKKLGFLFADSKANFIFTTHKTCKARDIFEAAEKKNIYVRFFNSPRIDNYLRISIGTREQMQMLLDFLKEFVASNN